MNALQFFAASAGPVAIDGPVWPLIAAAVCLFFLTIGGLPEKEDDE